MGDKPGTRDHDRAADRPRRRHGPRVWITNMKVEMPLKQKLRLLVINNWIRIRYRQSCCGHHGEPGC